MAKKLTVKGLNAIKPTEARREHPDGLVSGLYLVVQPSGKRSWAIRYRVGDRTRKHTLGSASAIDLVEARDLAKAALVEVAKGNDPGAAKQAARHAKPELTVAAFVDLYVEKYAKQHTRAVTARETERVLKRELVKRLGLRPIASITRADLREIISDHVDDGQVATAIRFRALVSKMFNWAVEQDYVKASPCVNLGTIKPPESSERNLSPSEILGVTMTANLYPYPFGPFIRFLLATGQRRTMVAETPWTEIDMEKRIWTIPKERMKNRKEHVIHISQYVWNILRALPTYDQGDLRWEAIRTGFLFSNQDGLPISGFSDRKAAFDLQLVKSGYAVAPWKLHDLRRTASTSMSELGTEQLIIDMILSHQTSRTKDVGMIYNRNQQLKKRKEAIEKWGNYLDEIEPWNPPIDRGEYGEKVAEGRY